MIWLLLLGIYFSAVNFWAFAPTLQAFATNHFIKTIVVMFAALALCDSKRALDYYLVAFVVGAAYIGYYTLEVGRNQGNRVTGVGTVDAPDVNDMAAMLAPAAIIALHWFWQARKGIYRLLVIAAGALIVNALVLMNSRGAYLGLLVGAAYYMLRLFMTGPNIKHFRLKVIATCLAGLLSLSIVVDQSAINRFLSLTTDADLTTEQETGSTRVFFWLAAFEMAKDFPLGRGFQSFTLNSDQYIPEGVNTGSSRNRAVHSSWFQALTEVGFPGTGLFIIMLAMTSRALIKTRRHCAGKNDISGLFTITAIEAACLSYLISMTFLDRMRAEALYWLILFASAAYQLYYLNDTKPALNKGLKRRKGTVPDRGSRIADRGSRIADRQLA